MKIQKVLATEILDSRGTPTVGATVILSDGSVGTANAPSGASTGKFEAHEKRDNDRKRYLGRGVKKAVEGIEETVAPVLENMQRVTVQNVDRMLIELDNTKNKEKQPHHSNARLSLPGDAGVFQNAVRSEKERSYFHGNQKLSPP